MTSRRILFKSFAAVIVTIAVILLVFPVVTGVRDFYFNHVIATFELRGARSSDEADAALRQFATSNGVRNTTLAQSSWGDSVWIARIQYQAADLSAGRQSIRHWIETTPAPLTLRLVKAAYYPCRLHRPGKADVVIGKTVPFVLSD
jgi:hypothetical protein